MKKILSMALCLMLISVLLPVVTLADSTEDVEREYYSDGSYLETVLTVEPRLAREKTRLVGTKNSTYYNASGVAQWKASLTGVFYYDGTSCACNESHINYLVYDSAWNLYSKQEYGSKNTANGTITMSCSRAGSETYYRSKTFKITCDKDGNLS